MRKFNFLFFQKKYTFAPIWTSPQSESDAPPALATLHQPLQAMSEIHSSFMFVQGVIPPHRVLFRLSVCLNDSPPPFFVI